jgi:cytochrome P450
LPTANGERRAVFERRSEGMISTAVTRRELPPGRLPLVGHMLSLALRRRDFLQSMRSHGDVVEVRLGRRPAFIVNSPDLVRQLLVTKAESVERGRLFQETGRFVGSGIGISDGPFHRQQRRMMRPAFHPSNLRRYAELIRSLTDKTTESWRPGQALALDRHMMDLSLAAVTRSLFSTRLSDADAAVINTSLPILERGALWRTVLPIELLKNLPTQSNRRFATARLDLRRVLDDVIAGYRADSTDHRDLLSVLLMARDPRTGTAMTDAQVHDEAMSILVAGAETTGLALNSVFYELAKNPVVEKRLHAELDNTLGDRPIEYDDIAKLSYTARVIKETLRLHTPVWLTIRRTTKPIELSGSRVLPVDVDLMFSPHTMHRDPNLYPEPLRFDPDRWLPDRMTDLPKSAFIPFLTGPHQCIGEHFALMELAVMIATIASRWRLQPQPGYRVRELAGLLVHFNKLPMIAADRRKPQITELTARQQEKVHGEI